MKKLLILLAFLIPGVQAAEVGGYGNATTPLSGTERLLADQNMVTVNITPAQIASYIASGGYIYQMLPALVNGYVLSNNGTTLQWVPNSGGGGGGGTVTSVGLTMPAGLSVANSPVTTNGTINVTTTLSGPIKGTGSGFSAATYADIVNLFSGCTGTEYLAANGNCYAASGSGTVTSVGLTAPSWLTVSGSPVTTSGTLGLAAASQSANTFLASPSGASGAPSFRAIVSADLPATIAANTTGNAATATALATSPTQCGTGQFATGVAASGNANCGTHQVNGVALTGTTPINFINSAATNGLTLTFTNTTAGVIQLGLSGTLANAGLTNSSVTLNGQAISLGSSGNVNNGAAQYSIALNGAAGAAIAGITLPGATGIYCIDYTSLTANPTLTSCPAAPTLQTNGTNNSSQTTLNIQSGTGISVSNPSGGNVTVNQTQAINAQTGTTYTVASTDASKFITFNNASAVAVTLPQATGSFGAGFAITVQNLGAGTVTITPTTSTINGQASLTIPTGYGCGIVSDGTNYQLGNCPAVRDMPITLSAGATVTPNCSANNNVVTITANVTFAVPANCTPFQGQRIFFDVIATSAYTYTFTGYLAAGSSVAYPTAHSATGADHMELIYEGTAATKGWVLDAINPGIP
jgi:hypothetical protein